MMGVLGLYFNAPGTRREAQSNAEELEVEVFEVKCYEIGEIIGNDIAG